MKQASTVWRFPPNRQGRDFVCGDIHGGWPLLERALTGCDFRPDRDRLFCVGDLIDRGPESARFPEYLARDWFHAVAGNHEQMALRAVLEQDREAEAVWWMNGGGWILDIGAREGRALVKQLASLPLAIEVEGFGPEPVVLVHAGLPGHDWPAVRDTLAVSGDDARTTREPVHSLLWDRQRLMRGDDAPVSGACHLFHGHTVLEDVACLGNRTYLDLGSVMTGRIGVVDIGRWLARSPGSRDGLHIAEDSV